MVNEEDGVDVTGRKDTAEVSGNGNTVSVRVPEAAASVELPREDDAGGPYVAVITGLVPVVTLVEDAVVGAFVLGEVSDVVVAGPTGEVSDDNGGTLQVGT